MIEVIKAGFYTTIQDMGRFGYRDKGVPVAGVMDEVATTYANRLLGNEVRAAVMEITMIGPALLFSEPTYVVITGATIQARHNETPIENNTIIQVHKGDHLTFGRVESGFRAYLAVKGGLRTEEILGSRSFFKPVTPKAVLSNGDQVFYTPNTILTKEKIVGLIKPDFSTGILSVFKGPEYDLLNEQQQGRLFSKGFTVAKENNRMAYQMTEPMAGIDTSIITSATLPGTVQLTPDGKVIVLMKDGQTTGGYPRILQLSKEAIAILAQQKTGDSIRFRIVG